MWYYGWGEYWNLYRRVPDQPIAFSHEIHVNNVRLACELCHIYTDKSIAAGIPSVQQCMDCHTVIARDRPEIKKLHQYWNDTRPIPWIKVHQLPPHVYFSHKRHIKKDIPCSECHGEVRFMDQIRKVRSLNMGWCVTCHKDRGASIDCLTCHQ